MNFGYFFQSLESELINVADNVESMRAEVQGELRHNICIYNDEKVIL